MECTSAWHTVRCVRSAAGNHVVRWKSFCALKDDVHRSTTNCDLAADSEAAEEQSSLRSEGVADWRRASATVTDEAINVNSKLSLCALNVNDVATSCDLTGFYSSWFSGSIMLKL